MNKPVEENNEPIEQEQKEPVADPTPTTETEQPVATAPAAPEKPNLSQTDRREGRRSRHGQDSKGDQEGSGFMEKVLAINRITKVTKGGKKLSFSVLVVVGDMNGKVGYALCKAGEVATAIRKAMNTAKKNMITVRLKGTTIPHEIIGRCSGAEVLLKPAFDGTGVIASGPVRAICDGVGIHNILTKCHRSNNPINVVKATIDALSRFKTSIRRGIDTMYLNEIKSSKGSRKRKKIVGRGKGSGRGNDKRPRGKTARVPGREEVSLDLPKAGRCPLSDGFPRSVFGAFARSSIKLFI